MISPPICQLRGFCGPFVDAEHLASAAEWVGAGSCVHCQCAVRKSRSPRLRPQHGGLLLVSGVALS